MFFFSCMKTFLVVGTHSLEASRKGASIEYTNVYFHGEIRKIFIQITPRIWSYDSCTVYKNQTIKIITAQTRQAKGNPNITRSPGTFAWSN